MNFKKAEIEQLKISSKAILKDDFPEIKLIGGAGSYCVGTTMVACAITCYPHTFEVKEKTFVKGKIDPTIPHEFQAFGEGPLLGEALSNLNEKPNLLMFCAEGFLHPRKCGLATHLGVLFDIASIGVSKELLWGEQKGTEVMMGKEKLGMMVKTKDHANPIIVSTGHRISLSKAVETVKSCIREPHKMPEPLHLAHKFAKKYFLDDVSLLKK